MAPNPKVVAGYPGDRARGTTGVAGLGVFTGFGALG